MINNLKISKSMKLNDKPKETKNSKQNQKIKEEEMTNTYLIKINSKNNLKKQPEEKEKKRKEKDQKPKENSMKIILD